MQEAYDDGKRLSYGEQKDLIYDCQKKIGDWYGYFAQNIRVFRDDRLFYQGQQWPDWCIKMLQEEQIPEIVINKIKPIIRIIMGSISSLDPQLTLIPTDTKLTQGEELEIYLDILRAAAYNTDACLAYAQAAENMLTGGWGVVQVGTKYKNATTFNQDLFIRGIKEPSQVFFDHNAQHPSKCDSREQGIFTFMSNDDFKHRYPGAEPPDRTLLLSGIPYYEFMTTDDVVVCEYYKTDYKNETLIALSNGTDYAIEVTKKQVPAELEKYYQMQAARGIPQLRISPLIEVRRRSTKIDTIMCYELNGQQVLKSYEWISKHMPFVFFDCNSTYRDGKQWTESYIYPAKDPQRIYNFCMSQAVYATEIMRKERIFATPEQTEGYDDLYKYPQKALAYMPYNPDARAPGPPVVVPAAEISMTYFKEAEVADMDIQKVLGMYEPINGQLSNVSGAANMTALMQANVALKPILAKLFIGMEQVGRVSMDIIPKIYDTERVVKTQKSSGEVGNVVVNKFSEWNPETKAPVFKNDISKMVMDLEVKPGASFETQQMMEDQKLLEVLKLSPEFASSGGDLMASRIGTPAGYTLSKRLSAFVPPPAMAAEKGEKFQPPPDPMQQMQMEAMKAEIKKVNAEADAKMKDIEIKQEKLMQDQQNAELKHQEMMAEFYETLMKANAEVKKAESEADIAHMEHAIKLHTGVAERAADLHKHQTKLDHEKSLTEMASRKKAKVIKRT